MSRITMLADFYKALGETIALLERDEQSARSFFNRNVYPIYANLVSEESGPLLPFFVFFQELDEFLNNPGYRALGEGNAVELIATFRSDVRERYQQALENEKGAQQNAGASMDS